MTRLISFILSFILFWGPSASYAQGAMDALGLPLPGVMVSTSQFLTPPLLKGVIVDVKAPLSFRFVVDSGKAKLPPEELNRAVEQQTKYFLTGLAVSSKDLWVNLSPYEKDRMIPEALGKTDLGRDMLAQDYLLKQLSASMIHPDQALGKDFWTRVYAQAQERFGTTDIPVDTFNKIWIMPDDAVVFEEGNRGYITRATLKVLLEEDYLALEKGRAAEAVSPGISSEGTGETRALTTQIMREIVLPAVAREVNEGANFAPLRQIYHALVLAKWYKEMVSNQLLEQLYFDKGKVEGVDLADPNVREEIYQRYVDAYKTGVFNYIKEETDLSTGEAYPRKYFSGGENFDFAQIPLRKISDRNGITQDGDVFVADVDLAQTSGADDLVGRLGYAEEVDPLLMAEVYRAVREHGIFLNQDALKDLPGPFLAGALHLLNMFNGNRYSADQLRTEAPQAQYVIAQLSNSFAAHEVTHLFLAATVVENFLSPSVARLPPEGVAELRVLEKRAQAVMQDNLGIKLLLSKMAVFSSPERAIAFQEKILAHIEEAKTLTSQVASFGSKYQGLGDGIEMVPELCNSALGEIVAFEEKVMKLRQDASAGVIIQDIDFPRTVAGIARDLEKGYRVNIIVSPEQDIPTGRTIFFSYYDLRALLEVLIDNARQAARPDAPVQITVSAAYEGNDAVLRVGDNGKGMTSEQLSRMRAQEMFTTKGAFGSGQGLMAVREAVRLYSGSLEVDSVLGQGTTFTLRFPLEKNTDQAMSSVFLATASITTMATSQPGTALSVIGVIAVAAPALLIAARHWAVTRFKQIFQTTQDSQELLKTVRFLSHFMAEKDLSDLLFSRYMDRNDGIRRAVRETLNRDGAYADVFFRWLARTSILDRLAHPHVKVRQSAKDMLSDLHASLMERAEAYLAAAERAVNKSGPSSVGVIEDNLLDLLSIRKQMKERGVLSNNEEPRRIDGLDRKTVYVFFKILGWGPLELFPLAAKAIDHLSPGPSIILNLYRDIIEDSPRLEARLEIFKRLSSQEQREAVGRLWERLLYPHMLFDISVDFLLKTGFKDRESLRARVLDVMKRNHYMQEPLRTPHIRALELLGVEDFYEGMEQRAFERAIDAAQIRDSADRAMGFSAVSLAAVPLATVDFSDSKTLWTVTAVVAAALPATIVAVKHWAIRYYTSVVRNTQDPRALIKSAESLRFFSKEDQFLDELAARYMDMNPSIRAAMRTLAEKFGYKDFLTRWMEGQGILVHLADRDPKVRTAAAAFMAQFQLSQFERAEAYLVTIEREVNKGALASAEVIEENLSALLADRKKIALSADGKGLEGRKALGRIDEKAAQVITRVVGWGPERSFPLALTILDQFPFVVAVSKNLLRDIFEESPRVQSRIEVFRRLPQKDQKEMAQRVWDRLLEPHMSFDISVQFLLQSGAVNRDALTARVLEVLRRNPYIQDPLRAPHIRALNFLGVQGFSNVMSQRQFEKAILEVRAPQEEADRAMLSSAFSVLAATYADPAVVDRVLEFLLEDHLSASISIAAVGAVASTAGLAALVRKWNARAHANLLNSVRYGSVDSRIEALVKIKGQGAEYMAYDEFLKLLNDPEIVFTPQQKDRLEKGVFLFGMWIARDMPLLLIDPKKDVRDHARRLLRGKVSPREEGEAYLWAMRREFMRLSNTKHDYHTNPVLLELIDDLLTLRAEFGVMDLDGKFEKVLVSMFSDGDILSMEKIRDAVVVLRQGDQTSRINRDIVRGTVDAEFSKRLLSRLESPVPLVNVEDAVLFLRQAGAVKSVRMRSLVLDVFRTRWEQMDQSLRNRYLTTLALLGTEGVYQGMDQGALKTFFGIDRGPFATSDPAQIVKGGIDVSGLDVTRTGKGIEVSFDPAMLAGFSKGTFKGFKPVIVGIAPAMNVSSALGL